MLNTKAFVCRRSGQTGVFDRVWRFLVTGIGGNVENELVVKTELAQRFGVERNIGIESCLVDGAVPVV